MRLVIPGEPVPKGRPRVNRATGTFYTPPETRAWEKTIAFLAMASKEKLGSQPVRVGVVFFTAKKKPADLDNLTKSVLDGLNGQAFDDDSQVCEVHVARVRSASPRVEILVEACDERTELQDVGEVT